MNNGEKKESWVTAYNYPCLLNIPDEMEKIGPLTNIWEGGVRGEGFLRYVKPEHSTMGLRRDWEERILGRILNRKALDIIVKKETGKEREYAMQLYYKYSNTNIVERDMENGVCMSVLKMKNGEWGVHIGKCKYKALLLDQVNVEEQVGFMYFKWTWNEDKPVETYEKRDVEYSCLLLPLPGKKPFYACIKDDWSQLNESGLFE